MKIVNIEGTVHAAGVCCVNFRCKSCGGLRHGNRNEGPTVCEQCDAADWSEAPDPILAKSATVREPTDKWRRLVYPNCGNGNIYLLVVAVGSGDAPLNLSAHLRCGTTPEHACRDLRRLADRLEKLENDYTGKVDKALDKRLDDEIPF